MDSPPQQDGTILGSLQEVLEVGKLFDYRLFPSVRGLYYGSRR